MAYEVGDRVVDLGMEADGGLTKEDTGVVVAVQGDVVLVKWRGAGRVFAEDPEDGSIAKDWD